MSCCFQLLFLGLSIDDLHIAIDFYWNDDLRLKLIAKEHTAPLAGSFRLDIDAGLIESTAGQSFNESLTKPLYLKPISMNLVDAIQADADDNTKIQVTFLEPMNKSSVEAALTLKQHTILIPLSFHWEGNKLTLQDKDSPETNFFGEYTLSMTDATAFNENGRSTQKDMQWPVLFIDEDTPKSLGIKYILSDTQTEIIFSVDADVTLDSLKTGLYLMQDGNQVTINIARDDQRVLITQTNNAPFEGEYVLTGDDSLLLNVEGKSLIFGEPITLTFVMLPETVYVIAKVMSKKIGNITLPEIQFSESMDTESVIQAITIMQNNQPIPFNVDWDYDKQKLKIIAPDTNDPIIENATIYIDADIGRAAFGNALEESIETNISLPGISDLSIEIQDTYSNWSHDPRKIS